MPSPPSVTITAVSAENSSANGSANISLTDDIVVTVSPSSANVPAGGAQNFAASVAASGNPTLGVVWSVNGITEGNPVFGTIAPGSGGTASYLAPTVLPPQPTVTVTATSLADPT